MKESKNKSGRPKNLAREKHERELGVSARRVQQIISEIGIDKLDDMAKLRLIEKRVIIGLRTLQSRREEHELNAAKRSVIPVDEARQMGFKIGNLVTQFFAELEQNAPVLLVGRSEVDIALALRKAGADCVNELRAKVAKL